MDGYDHRLAAGLHTLVDDAAIPVPPTEIVLHRGRRARRRRTVTGIAASGGVLALAIAGLAAIGVTDPADRKPSPPVATGTAPDPAAVRLRLVSALDATAGASFTQTIAIAIENRAGLGTGDRDLTAHLDGLRMTGPFDPKARTGHLRSERPDGSSGEQRLVAGELFVGDGRRWKKVPGQHAGFSVASLVTDGVGLSDDPTRFLATLRELGRVEQVTAAGTDAETYRFKGQVRARTGDPGRESAAGDVFEISGDVTVATAGNRITRVTYRVPLWHTAGRPDIIALVTIGLSGHGAPVSVERPTDAVD